MHYANNTLNVGTMVVVMVVVVMISIRLSQVRQRAEFKHIIKRSVKKETNKDSLSSGERRGKHNIRVLSSNILRNAGGLARDSPPP